MDTHTHTFAQTSWGHPVRSAHSNTYILYTHTRTNTGPHRCGCGNIPFTQFVDVVVVVVPSSGSPDVVVVGVALLLPNKTRSHQTQTAAKCDGDDEDRTMMMRRQRYTQKSRGENTTHTHTLCIHYTHYARRHQHTYTTSATTADRICGGARRGRGGHRRLLLTELDATNTRGSCGTGPEVPTVSWDAFCWTLSGKITRTYFCSARHGRHHYSTPFLLDFCAALLLLRLLRLFEVLHSERERE